MGAFILPPSWARDSVVMSLRKISFSIFAAKHMSPKVHFIYTIGTFPPTLTFLFDGIFHHKSICYSLKFEHLETAHKIKQKQATHVYNKKLMDDVCVFISPHSYIN